MSAEPAILRKVTENGRRSGFANLLRKEIGSVWSARRWWKYALLWLVLMNGGLPIVYFVVKAHPELPLDMLDQLTRFFFSLGGVAAAIGAVVVGQDAIIGERQSGTAAWILSKPASRPAFVLTKLLAQIFNSLTLMVLLQSLVAYGQIYLMTGTTLEPLQFLTAAGLLALNQLFYISLTLMLGVLLKSRAAVMGIGLGWLLGGGVTLEVAPWLVHAFPLQLLESAVQTAKGGAFESITPLISATLWSVLFVAVALWRFEREEL